MMEARKTVNRNCPNQDGPLMPDPYDAGIVECAACGLRYHHPCAGLFEDCDSCGAPLRTKRVFRTKAEALPAEVKRAPSPPPPPKPAPIQMVRKSTISAPPAINTPRTPPQAAPARPARAPSPALVAAVILAIVGMGACLVTMAQ